MLAPRRKDSKTELGDLRPITSHGLFTEDQEKDQQDGTKTNNEII